MNIDMLKKIFKTLFNKEKKSSTKQLNVQQVFSYGELGYNSTGGFWDVITVDIENEYIKDHRKEDEEALVNKIFNYLQISKNFRFYVERGTVYYSCDNDKLGKIIGSYRFGFYFFTFGVAKNKTRYDINYALNSEKYYKFKKWLFEHFDYSSNIIDNF